MKKNVLIILITATCLIEALYIFSSFGNSPAKETAPLVEFTDSLKITVDERSFAAEDPPENKAEEAVFRYWLAKFLIDSQLREDSIAQNGMFEIELENSRKADQAGEHILKILNLHDLETVCEENGQSEAADRLQMEVIEESGLTEYEIVKLQWTEEREDPVNYGNGFHQRYYICGRTKKDPEWRIYGFGFM